MTKNSDFHQILKTVTANYAALEGCEGPHDCEPIPDGHKFPRRVRCKRCGGTMEKLNWSWYQRGLEHGRKHSRPGDDDE